MPINVEQSLSERAALRHRGAHHSTRRWRKPLPACRKPIFC